MHEHETLDELRRVGLRLIQPRSGYRYSIDSLILCDFVKIGTSATAIDLGTGCGVIPLVLARLHEGLCVTGVEFQAEMFDIALRNVTLNGLEDRVGMCHDDIINVRRRFPVSSFDLVTANPPYRNPGSGRVSPRAGRDRARHESSAGLLEFISAAKYLVKPGGRICFIYHPSRLAEFVAVTGGLNLSLLRLRMVHGTLGAEARMFCAELAKGRKGDVTVEPPLVIFRDDGKYTAEAERILGESAGGNCR